MNCLLLNYIINKKTQQLLTELPFFCNEFFRGIENQTTTLTRFNYAQDLKIFFNFLVTEILEFNDKTIKNITIEDLSKITATHIEIFLNYLSGYYVEDKYFSNNEKGKARKLATIRSFLKYFYKKEKISSNVSSKIETPKIHNKEIIRLEVDEVVKLITQAESPTKFSVRQTSYNNITKTKVITVINAVVIIASSKL